MAAIALRFLQLENFAQDWAMLGLDDEDLRALELEILQRPQANPIVRGTGGLRKTRFAPRRWRKGKRGAVRVGYAYLQQHRAILLIVAYAKQERDDLSAAERKIIHNLLQRIEREFAKGLIR